jgi:hypothetical protein
MKMEIADYNGTSILVIQEKTGAKVKIKVHRDLKPHLDRRIAELRKRGIIGGAIFRNRYDRPMKVSTLSLRWNEAVEKIGFADDGLQRRDLRRTAVIRLSEAGCDVPLITSITGHSLVGARSILQDYFVRTEDNGSYRHHEIGRLRRQAKGQRMTTPQQGNWKRFSKCWKRVPIKSMAYTPYWLTGRYPSTFRRTTAI